MRGRLFLGTSGYVYPHWRRRFYPAELPAREWLSFYARHFDTVELNNPFYRLPRVRRPFLAVGVGIGMSIWAAVEIWGLLF